MRTIHALPLVAAMLLAGCGDKADKSGEGTVSNEAVAAAAEGLIEPRPGQYRTSLELLEFDVPGMTDQMKAQMRSMVGGEFAKGNTYCLTPEEAAANGSKRMAENMAEGNCTFSKFDVSAGTLSADMQCTGDDGLTSHVLMNGIMTQTSSDMTMTMNQQMEGVGQLRMKIHAKSERIGDCG
jgi:hypothetical protein